MPNPLPLLLRVLAILAVTLVPVNGRAAIEIAPVQPQSMQPVYLEMSVQSLDNFSVKISRATMTMTDNVITVTYEAIFDDEPIRRNYIELGRFPAGDYQVRVRHPFGVLVFNPADGTTESVTSLAFTVSPKPDSEEPANVVPLVDYSGLWWSPSTPGWGISIEQFPDNFLHAVWYAYDADGRKLWYSFQSRFWHFSSIFPGTARTNLVVNGIVYETTGLPDPSARVSLGAITTTPIADAWLVFDGPLTGVLEVAWHPKINFILSQFPILRFPWGVYPSYP